MRVWVCVHKCVFVSFSKNIANWEKIAFYCEEGTSVTGSAKCMIAFKPQGNTKSNQSTEAVLKTVVKVAGIQKTPEN